MPDLTRLHRIIVLAYKMQPEDEAQLRADIYAQHGREWRQALAEEAARVGVTRPAQGPRGQREVTYFRTLAEQDARSITNTYNADLEREIVRLYDTNPRGNRNYYISNLERWYDRRSAWKDRQIALMNRQNARSYAKVRFYEENNMRGGSYYYEGPAPVSDECKFRMAQGVVSQDFVDGHPTPAHINCPHEWAAASVPAPQTVRELWIG